MCGSHVALGSPLGGYTLKGKRTFGSSASISSVRVAQSDPNSRTYVCVGQKPSFMNSASIIEMRIIRVVNGQMMLELGIYCSICGSYPQCSNTTKFLTKLLAHGLLCLVALGTQEESASGLEALTEKCTVGMWPFGVISAARAFPERRL